MGLPGHFIHHNKDVVTLQNLHFESLNSQPAFYVAETSSFRQFTWIPESMQVSLRYYSQVLFNKTSILVGTWCTHWLPFSFGCIFVINICFYWLFGFYDDHIQPPIVIMILCITETLPGSNTPSIPPFAQ